MFKVFIDGSAGTTGLRIYERIKSDASLQLLTLNEAVRKDAHARREMLCSADVAFLCLPDEAAKEAAALCAGAEVRLIDASTAHRTAPGWAYGFPELSAAHRQNIRESRWIAVPGCHASGFLALVVPLLAAGVLSAEALLSVTSITGYSGGGKPMIAAYAEPDRGAEYAAPRQYATLQAHKHIPEMTGQSGLLHAPVFQPVVADFYAGMLVSIPLHGCMLQNGARLPALREVYAAHYAGQAMVRVLPVMETNGFLAANALGGKDTMEILVAGNGERITLYARYDNLGKGASGAALQCMNIILNREETNGLVL